MNFLINLAIKLASSLGAVVVKEWLENLKKKRLERSERELIGRKAHDDGMVDKIKAEKEAKDAMENEIKKEDHDISNWG